MMDGDGHLLITDSQGRQLGFVIDQYIEKIPGGYGLVSILGTQTMSEAIYIIPLTDTYSILLEGQTLPLTAPASLAQFSPGYGVSVDNVTVSPTTHEQLSIANNGSQVKYHTASPRKGLSTSGARGG